MRCLQRPGCGDQGCDIRLRIQVGCGPAILPRQQVRRRRLGHGVDPAQVNSEAANNRKPGNRPASTPQRQCRPSEGRLGCQMVFAAILDEGEELSEEFLGSNDL